jgi:hypothetical protein
LRSHQFQQHSNNCLLYFDICSSPCLPACLFPRAVSTFSTEQQALALANDSEYGLGGAVISADAERCKRVAEGLECGIVWVNCSQPCFCQVSLPDHLWQASKHTLYQLKPLLSCLFATGIVT